GRSPAARARARVPRPRSRGARAVERSRARPVRGPYRGDQRRHPRRARRDRCGAHGVSRGDGCAGCRASRSRILADEALGPARRGAHADRRSGSRSGGAGRRRRCCRGSGGCCVLRSGARAAEARGGRMITRVRIAVVLALAVALVGCGGKKDKSEPPAELTDFQPSIVIDKVWSSKVGGKSERLRLGLRPATDGARIFAGAYDGQVASFDAETGDKVWAIKTGLPLTAGPGFGDGLLTFGTANGDLLALDAATGQERWRQPIGSEVLATPAIGSGVIVVRTVDGRLRGFSAANGST